ncbi:hypothetical protein FAI40_03340 [Acetobacteraceae bacterium]|nr:hypothetical protein FAI40_03340 [Acetobacteraceae bacterium]
MNNKDMEEDKTWVFSVLLFVWAIVLRLPTFGHPLLYIDEDWYLYVGGQLLHGYLPYVDVWDRKPFGLFLLYAPFSLFGPFRFLAYQIAALFFVWGTSLLIDKMARKFTTPLGGFLAGMLYPALLGCFLGCGGQTPIFYNFFTALAVCLFFEHWEELKTSPQILRKTGNWAMLLLGCGIQIKPTIIFEGIFFGCLLLFFCWKSERNLKSFCLNALVWVAIALSPTALFAGFYLAIGHFQDWYFANVISIFCKDPTTPFSRYYHYAGALVVFVIVACILIIALRPTLDRVKKQLFDFTVLWTFVAFVSASLFRPYYGIYLLPFLLPFSLFAAFCTCRPKYSLEKIILSIGLAVATLYNEKDTFRLCAKHPIKEYYDIQRIVMQRPNACFFEYGAISTMLDLTPEMAKNCHLTKYSFPSHLGNIDEQGSLGVPDEAKLLENILNQNPTFILVGQHYIDPLPAPIGKNKAKIGLFKKKHDLVENKLRQDYHFVYAHVPTESLMLYEKNKTP